MHATVLVFGSDVSLLMEEGNAYSRRFALQSDHRWHELNIFQMKPDGKIYFTNGFLHQRPTSEELVSEVCRKNTWSLMPALAIYYHTMLLCRVLLLNSSVRLPSLEQHGNEFHKRLEMQAICI